MGEQRILTKDEVSIPHNKAREELLGYFDQFFSQMHILNLTDMFASFCLMRGYKTFGAVGLLASNGLDEDAVTLCRTLMETDIILKWTLAEDTESRLEKFADWEQTRLKKMRKAWEAWNPTHDVPDMIDVDSSGKLGVSWSGISLKQMAESVGLGSSYDIEYSYLCEYAHGTATTFGDYVNVAEILGPDALPVDRTQKSLFYANKYWHSILETAGKHFGVQDDGRLGAIAVYIRDALAAEQFLDAIWEGIEKCTCHTYRLFYVDYNCFRLEAESKDTHEVLSSPEMEFVFPSEPGVTDANDFRDYAHELLASIHAAPE